uniref:Synaptogyrin 2 n=1 Tax=Myotis myotis TaxID=51298 RepID=A0A7J7T9J1_MYOMY|nr:synaptogyrin 2 [Myotis myotis]
MESGAYGAAKAGGSFDLRRFLAQPQVVARAVSLVFALIVFSCIFGEGYSNTHESHQRYCVFNRNEDACRYGSAIGVLAFLACAFFFVVDVYFPQISNAVDRKYLVIGDLLFSVGSHQPEGCAAGSGLSPSGHHLQLLFHLLLGPAGRPGLPALQGRGGRLYAELRGPHPRPQHSLRLLPGPAGGQLPAASVHSELGGHRGLPASRCVLSRRRGW